ncbi:MULTISPECIES: LysR substrate-binding domain-containing protein [unclassified Variovorax]|uniref:LysR substrate-binding domain-containing protein n=1 Tax=unclassified Variovorax TaxID=663243 RepID=UPI001BD5F588|nr:MULTISPECIES: LysR substrate-binding domain-containing protein [unclassified Variovorax]
MKLNALRDFQAVAERGSLRAAARQLGVAQPAMSRSIQELEKELGVTLFERRAKGVSLTSMGELFLRRTRAVRSELRRAQDEIAQARGAMHGQIRMCLSSVAHMALLPGALRPFHERYPDVRLEIIDGVVPSVEAELLDGAMDLYIGPAPLDLSPRLEVEKLFDNHRAIFGRIGHPLSDAMSLAELVGTEWVTTSATYRAEDELCPVFLRHGLPLPRLVVRGHSAFTFFFSIVQSDMLAMLPVQWARAPLFSDSLQRIEVKEELSALPICIVRRVALPLTPVGEYFCTLMRGAVTRATE